MTAPGISRYRTGAGMNELAVVGMAVLTILGAAFAGILAADGPILAVAAAGSLALLTVMILRPDAATLATIAILYSNAAVIAVRFHGIPLFVGASVPLLLVIPLARDLIVRRLPVVAPPMMPWMIALLFIHVVSTLFSVNMIRAWDATLVFAVEGVGLYFLLINVIRTPEVLRQATWVLLGVGAFVGLLSIHQDLTNNYESNYGGFAQASNATFRTGAESLTGDVLQRRLAGSVGETNRFAQILLMLVPLGLFRAIAEPSAALRAIAVVMTAIITLGVVLTFSRGAAVGMAALVVALAVLRMVQLKHVIAMTLALALVFVAFPHYWARVTTLEQIGSLADEDAGAGQTSRVILSRATETLAAALVIVDHPILGVGPNMFPIYYEAYAKEVGLLVHLGSTRESHNLYMGLGADIGLVGLAVFLTIAFLTMRMILIARRRSIDRRPDLQMLATPFLLSLLTYYVTGMFLHLSFGRFYWLILAMGTAAAVITLREMTRPDQEATGPTTETAGR